MTVPCCLCVILPSRDQLATLSKWAPWSGVLSPVILDAADLTIPSWAQPSEVLPLHSLSFESLPWTVGRRRSHLWGSGSSPEERPGPSGPLPTPGERSTSQPLVQVCLWFLNVSRVYSSLFPSMNQCKVFIVHKKYDLRSLLLEGKQLSYFDLIYKGDAYF